MLPAGLCRSLVDGFIQRSCASTELVHGLEKILLRYRVHNAFVYFEDVFISVQISFFQCTYINFRKAAARTLNHVLKSNFTKSSCSCLSLG